ncbi:hypothetical protein BsWGS_21287 [Bradybaena similaris]
MDHKNLKNRCIFRVRPTEIIALHTN